MDLLKRELAPILPDAWKLIDAEATRVLRLNLAGRKLVDFKGPFGWTYAAVNTGRLHLLEQQPIEGVSTGLRLVQPLVEVIFDLRRRDIARQAGMNQLPDAKSALDHWVKRGMRAQLGTVSLLTGQLKIDLDLVAQGPMKLYGLRQDLPEVPAIASSRERISEAIQSIPYETLAQSLTEIITGIRDLVKSPEIEKTWDDLNRTIDTFDRVLASLEQRLPKILDGLQGSVEEAGATLRNANGKLDDLSGRIGPTIDELRATITELRAKSGTTLDETNGTLREMRTTLAKLDAEIQPTSASLRSTLDEARAAMAQLADASAPGAPMMLEMRRALEKLSKTLDAFAALASTLERQPESILKGKSGG